MLGPARYNVLNSDLRPTPAPPPGPSTTMSTSIMLRMQSAMTRPAMRVLLLFFAPTVATLPLTSVTSVMAVPIEVEAALVASE